MNNKAYFKDKVIIITGASGGIGRAAALAFARCKAKVVLAARNKEKLESLKEEILGQGGLALAIKTDICSFSDTQGMARETILKWGRIDILIANAGQYVQDAPGEIDLQAYERSLAVNFMGTLHAVKSVLPEMLRRGQGHIVVMNSLDAKKGIVGDGPYVAAKAALDGFGDVLRQELTGKGIGVTAIYPGRVDTAMIRHIKVPWISPKMSPEKVVGAIMRGVKRGKAVVVVPRAFSLLAPLNNMFPRLMDRAFRVLRIEGKMIRDQEEVGRDKNK
ncbi:MAG: SDR family NAD(P)-dependent oxidoreductase [Candidatus Aminicenantes bacterium]|nr:SDR family NAD(P)-dependent oxidoreductase [Candidatus Aminicenantes bacterium]